MTSAAGIEWMDDDWMPDKISLKTLQWLVVIHPWGYWEMKLTAIATANAIFRSLAKVEVPYGRLLPPPLHQGSVDGGGRGGRGRGLTQTAPVGTLDGMIMRKVSRIENITDGQSYVQWPTQTFQSTAVRLGYRMSSYNYTLLENLSDEANA